MKRFAWLKRFVQQGPTPRWTAASLCMAMLGAICVSCSPPPPGSPAAEQFCEFWAEVQEAPPATYHAVLVKDGLVALADDTSTTGDGCTDPAAAVDLEGATLAAGEEVIDAEGSPDAQMVAAMRSPGVSAGRLVLGNLSIAVLSAEIRPDGIRLAGNVNVRLDGVQSTIGFVGTLRDFQNWSVQLSSTGLTIPGVSSTPVVFSGSLVVANGVPSLELHARATGVQIGDITVNAAELDLTASPATGVSATVTGDVSVGNTTVQGTVDVSFDATGALVAASADLDVRLVGTQANRTTVDLAGTVHLDGNADLTTVSFSASGHIGALVVHSASGELTLDGDTAKFDAVFDIAQGANTVRYDGVIVWNGTAVEVQQLTLEAAGEISGTLTNGQTVSASGQIGTEMVQGQVRTVIDGDFTLGTLTASGSAIVYTNGVTTTLEVTADITSPGFTGQVTGSVVITAGVAELVYLDVTVDSLDLRGVSVADAVLRIRSTFGSPLDISLEGDLTLASDNTTGTVHGAVQARFGPDGRLLGLHGEVDVPILEPGGVTIEDLHGTVDATVDRLTLDVSGGIVLNSIVDVELDGTLTVGGGGTDWDFNGRGTLNLHLGPIDIPIFLQNFTFNILEFKAVRVGFDYTALAYTRYLEADFFFNPDGSCEKVVITAGGLVAQTAVGNRLPPALGCPVYTPGVQID